MLLFEPGTFVATPAVLGLLTQTQILALTTRHLSGIWGDIDARDAQANADALAYGGRLFSCYTVEGHRIWVITEADRSSTCIMTPDDY